jgi:hypothetical protein
MKGLEIKFVSASQLCQVGAAQDCAMSVKPITKSFWTPGKVDRAVLRDILKL